MVHTYVDDIVKTGNDTDAIYSLKQLISSLAIPYKRSWSF